MTFDPRNILVIDFGQLGDAVMSLPALGAIRERFPHAHITVAVGKPGAEVIEMSGSADATISVDRVALRDGFKPLSVLRVFQIVKDVRRRKFDFVIDLHSFSETNLLGFLSGAPKRLFSRRRGRSLDFLANLGIKDPPRVPRLATQAEHGREVDAFLRKSKADVGAPLIGLFPGAGHESRRWPLERFAQLADSLIRNDGARPIVFAGPEERALVSQMRQLFPAGAVILDQLTIHQLAAALARLAVFVSNDTGPMHIAAAVGAPVVLLLDRRAPEGYVPLSEPKRVIYSVTIPEILVEEVYGATRELLAAGRTEALFAS